MRSILYWTQVSRLGTDSFIPMIETLIATAISCADIGVFINRARSYPDLEEHERQEIIDMYYEFSELEGLNCRDAKAD